MKTAQIVGNLPLITLRVATSQQTDAWFNQVGGADIVGQWTGGFTTPFSQQIDGSLLVATVNNPANSAGAITNSWLWAYADGLLLNRSGAADGPTWTYSIESKAQPNPAMGAGGSGASSSGAINVNSGADPCLTVDPSQIGANNMAGVNQLVTIVSDQAGGVYSCFGEVSYSLLYLEPR